jgi:hypothetical protein
MTTGRSVAVPHQAKLYMVVLSDVDTINQTALERYLTDSRIVDGWSCPLRSLYFLRSTSEASSLRISLLEMLGTDATFAVAEVNPGNIDGKLPFEGWQWLWINFSAFRGKIEEGGVNREEHHER